MELESSQKNKVFVLPRLTETQRRNIPYKVNGLMVYDNTFNDIYIYHENEWYPAAVNPIILSNEFGLIDENDNMVFSGDSTLTKATTGKANMGFGFESLKNTLTGESNLGIGVRSLTNNLHGSDNIAIGHESQKNNLSGNKNISVGFESLFNNRTGNNNIALGNFAIQGSGNDIGNDNIGLGHQALYKLQTGYENIAIGTRALGSLTTGYQNIAIGKECLTNIEAGSRNTAVGHQSMFNSQPIKLVNCTDAPSLNTAYGAYSLYSNEIGKNNVAIGFPTLGTETGYKNRNIGITTYSLNAFSSGEDNIAIGSNSLAILENGSNNITFLGNFGQLITGTNNIGMGNTGFNYLINGQNNIGIGYSSFQHKPGLGTFSSNIGLGAYFIDYSFLKNNLSIPESGNYNIFIGNNVALRYEYGDNNILIGEFMGTQYSSLDLNNFGISTLDDGFKSGEGNIILGNRAFQNFNRGNNNIAIGDSVGHNLDGEGHLNNIIIGNKATFASTSCSNCLTIGNKIFGKYIYSDTLKLGFGQTNPTATLDINGVLYATSYSNSSDIRLKKNVEELEGAMAMVKELKPVSFHWKKSTGNPADKTNYGFIAQDIEKIDPNLVRTDEEGYKSVVYQEIIPILLQAAKELNEKLDELSR